MNYYDYIQKKKIYLLIKVMILYPLERSISHYNVLQKLTVVSFLQKISDSTKYDKILLVWSIHLCVGGQMKCAGFLFILGF